MKNEKSTQSMNATRTRNILSVLMVIIIVGACVGFYFGLQVIKTYALEVTHSVSDAQASGKNIEQLSVLKQQLVEREALVAKATQLFATPDTYQLQSLKDVQKYASEAGITISNTEFDKTAPATAGTTAMSSTAAAGHSVLITLQSPVSYAKFVQFLDAIEGNLPKMQITGVSISRPANASGDQITTNIITITVATR